MSTLFTGAVKYFHPMREPCRCTDQPICDRPIGDRATASHVDRSRLKLIGVVAFSGAKNSSGLTKQRREDPLIMSLDPVVGDH